MTEYYDTVSRCDIRAVNKNGEHIPPVKTHDHNPRINIYVKDAVVLHTDLNASFFTHS